MSTPNIRQWLAANNYSDVTAKIDKVMGIWEKAGKNTRRNWWDVLAGSKDGKPKMIEGVLFPVLCVARARKGWKATTQCLQRNTNEDPLPVMAQPRWKERK